VKTLLWTLATLLSHWRRHPANFALLLLGLVIAAALWSGVQALNEQARRSYDRAAAVFGASGLRSLVSTRGGFIPQDLYIGLRLAGWKASPVLEGTVRVGDVSFRLIGVEPMTLPLALPRGTSLAGVRDAADLERFLTPPWRTMVSPQTLADLGAAEGPTPALDGGRTLPPLTLLADAPPGVLIVDIGAAQALLNRPQRLSRLIVDARDAAASPPLAKIAGDALRFAEPEEESDLARMADSFHLNLTAFGLLAFLVGLFIVNASFGLAFEQRLPMLRTMRSVGVSARALTAAMLCETLAFALLAGGLGVACGYLIAAALLPNVAASLDGLYGAQVAGRLRLDPAWWASGLGMVTLGALAAAGGGLVKVLNLPALAIAKPYAWREAQQLRLRRQAVVAAAGFATALAAFVVGESLRAGFVMIAGALLGAALLLPLLLAAALRLGERSASGMIARWFWADSRQQLSALSLALMALLVALSTNIGVGSMVEGFRTTFLSWLDERLVAEIYLEAAGDEDARAIEAWLEGRPEVSAILPNWRAKIRLADRPADVIGVTPHETYRAHFPTLAAAGDAWEQVGRGVGALISEQLSRRLGARLGDMIDVPTAHGQWRVAVAGIYPDYGNPKGQLRVGLDAFMRLWPDAPRTGFSLRVAPRDVAGLIGALQAAFGERIARLVDQAAVKRLSSTLFERTFAVTAALNALTLLVSGVALFASLATLLDIRLAQLAPVWAVGVPRLRLSQLELVRALLFAAMTAAAAIPLGLFMAWCLVAVINVQAFGWRLPFHVFPGQWAQIFALALATAFVAAIWPILRLARTAPAELLQVFANER